VSDAGSPDDEAPPPEGDGAVAVPIEGELDLHTFAPRDVPSVVEEYVRECVQRGLREVRLVHGRGRGVQRAVVHRALRGLTEVAAFSDAAPSSGGWGATIVRLRGPSPADKTAVE
jgi:DNA-nicking Smr family endonuclease